MTLPYALPAWATSIDTTRVVALRGLPASGKTTIARLVQAELPAGSVIRINNDELTATLLGLAAVHSPENAAFLRQARVGLLAAALNIPTVRLVILDNTNLSDRTVRELEKTAHQFGAQFVVDDSLLNVPVEECIRRDASRERPVGENVIRKMASQAARLRPFTPRQVPDIAPIAPYHNSPELPATVIVDVDGTLALMGDRSPYDWHRVGEDTPNLPVVNHVRDLVAGGHHVTIMSGRDVSARAATQAWLDTFVAPGLPLFMRTAGDMRADDIVKAELFTAHIADKFHVRYVLDDRDRVVAFWRAVGLSCWQVAPGAF